MKIQSQEAILIEDKQLEPIDLAFPPFLSLFSVTYRLNNLPE